MIYTFHHDSETLIVMIACDISNKRGYFSLSVDRCQCKFDLRFLKFKTIFFSLLFFEQ